MLPTFIIGADLHSGKLSRVLPEYHPPEIGIFALYPVNRYLSVKVKLWVEFLERQLRLRLEEKRSEG
jgi:DNA-binding transcriptional LysR family regulator